MTKKTIKICGKETDILYCAAAETGYEKLSGKGIDTFLPTFGKNENGEVVILEEPKANQEDYIHLSIAAIAAAAEYNKTEMSITTDDILFNASKADITLLFTEVMKLRNEWYGLSDVIKNDEQIADEEKPKN